jgi:3-phosphoshikimate 1-carboxyvinyltransferase
MNLRVRPVSRLRGRVAVPGDKSISHRAALLGALAGGVTEIRGYLEAEDCLRSIAAIQALGVDVARKGPGEYRVNGVGLAGLEEPADVVACGNSGTTARLLLGVLAAQPFTTLLTGDASLRRRPMGRVAEPLTRMGAAFLGRGDGTRLPLAIKGVARPRALRYETPVASAQVKSAILLAGLRADGPVTVIEPAPSRDHSERMLRAFGAHVTVSDRAVTIEPGPLKASSVEVPGDISSAAFVLVAATLVSESDVTVSGVGVNPTRTGVLDALAAMGARIEIVDRVDRDEPSASLRATTAGVTGTTVSGALVPRLIDEIPVLAIAACVARGRTEVRDATELRVKESDRIGALARELGRMGARVEERADGFTIVGSAPLHGARVASGGDHRLAMALVVAGLIADGETVVEDVDCIATSFPAFAATMNTLAGGEAVTVEP